MELGSFLLHFVPIRLIDMTIEALRKRYESAGQSHLFTFWSKLTPEQKEDLKNQLKSLDIERVNRIYLKAISAEAEALEPGARSDAIYPLPKGASESLSNQAKVEEWSRIGLEAIARGEVGVLLMAGGQGTRLGSSAPKGCYDIGLPSHKSLFQYQAERIKRLQTLAEIKCGKPSSSVVIPWYIMTSGPTRRNTEDFYKKHQFFGLNSKDVIFFEQGQLSSSCLFDMPTK